MNYQTLNNYCPGKPLIIRKDYLSLNPGFTLKFLKLLDILGIFLQFQYLSNKTRFFS